MIRSGVPRADQSSTTDAVRTGKSVRGELATMSVVLADVDLAAVDFYWWAVRNFAIKVRTAGANEDVVVARHSRGVLVEA